MHRRERPPSPTMGVTLVLCGAASLLGCQGQTEQAQMLLATRRPVQAAAHAVAGL